MSMPSSKYNQYLAAIKAANDAADRDALRKIQMQLIAEYGANDDDVQYLLSLFKYYV